MMVDNATAAISRDDADLLRRETGRSRGQGRNVRHGHDPPRDTAFLVTIDRVDAAPGCCTVARRSPERREGGGMVRPKPTATLPAGGHDIEYRQRGSGTARSENHGGGGETQRSRASAVGVLSINALPGPRLGRWRARRRGQSRNLSRAIGHEVSFVTPLGERADWRRHYAQPGGSAWTCGGNESG